WYGPGGWAAPRSPWRHPASPSRCHPAPRPRPVVAWPGWRGPGSSACTASTAGRQSWSRHRSRRPNSPRWQHGCHRPDPPRRARDLSALAAINPPRVASPAASATSAFTHGRSTPMAASSENAGAVPALAGIGPQLLRAAAVGGLLGGLVMFFLMAGYNASAGTGFLTILNVCFAAWVFRGTAMTAAHGMAMHHGTMGVHHAIGT